MITLTLPPNIVAALGGSALIAYDKLVVEPNIRPTQQLIRLRLILTSSADLEAQPIEGTGTVTLRGSPSLEVEFDQLDFHRKIVLAGGAVAAVQSVIDTAQDSIENGLVAVGLVDGIQSPGA